MKRSLPELALKRPVTVMMLLITVMSFGLIAAMRTPVEFMPPMDLPFLGAYIPYPGATPAQTEQEIAIPAEGEFRTLPNLRQMYSNSSSDGCFVSLEFEMGTEMNTALAEVRDRMERLRLVLPDEVDNIYIRHFKLESLPVMQFVLSSDQDYDDFAVKVDSDILPKLQRIDGVAEIQVYGWRQQDVTVDIDQQALLSRNISLYDVIATLSTGNVDVGLGQMSDGDTKYMLRAESKLKTLADYTVLPVGNGVHLGEIAKGNFKAEERENHFSIDGERQIFMIVTKEAEANTAATCKAVMDALDEIMAQPANAGMQRFVFFNQGDIITGALNGLKKASIYGGIMALMVLFLFLRRLRPTIIVALAIPGSLVAAFVFLLAADMTLNIITMMSLIIAVGMVVDNAIVVIENIYRYQAMGHDQVSAAKEGASEVSLAIVAATCTTAVVFIPVFYIDGGQMSTFMRHFAIPVTVALGASLLLALTVIPLAVSRLKNDGNSPMDRLRRFSKDRKEGAAPSKLRFINPVFLFRTGYEFLLYNGMKHRLVSVIVLGLFVFLTVQVPMKKMQFQQLPTTDGRSISISLDFDVNYDMAKADEVFESVEAAIKPYHDAIGVKNVFKDYSARGGDLRYFLLKDDDMSSTFEAFPYSTEEVLNIIWYLLPENAPGVEISVSTDGSERGGGGSKQSRISVRMEGDDTLVLDGYAKRYQEMLEDLPGITSTRISSQRAEQEIQLDIDEELAGYMGIEPMMIAQTVAFALRGTQLSKMQQGAREITVWAQFEAEDRRNQNNLDNIMMAGRNGSLVTLNQLVKKRKATTPRTIQRRNGKNFVWITGNVAGKDMGEIRGTLADINAGFAMPTGYSVAMGDELQGIQEDQSNFISLLIMAVLLIFIVMSALFESCLLPLSILTTVPLAFLGVAWIMYITGTPMDTIAFIGCILMVGVVVNNGIVIVDHINQLRKQGLSRHEAIIQGGKNRLRPVLMTALTTILGAIPLAIGGRIGEPATVSLGMSMIGGLTAGTFLTLFVVPLFYSFIDDLQEWLKRFYVELGLVR